MALYIIPTIQNLQSLRKQLNAAFAGIFGTANAFTEAQTFPATGIVIGTVKIISGSGDPDGVVVAPVASLFLRTDGGAGTTLYTKEAGVDENGWVAV